MRFPSSASQRMTTHPGKSGTLPFLQTSYPYRCRSTNQRSRIGMRFPSPGTLPFLQTSYPYRCRSTNQRSRIGMRFPSSASPKTPLHPGEFSTTPFLQTSYPYRCRSTASNVIACYALPVIRPFRPFRPFRPSRPFQPFRSFRPFRPSNLFLHKQQSSSTLIAKTKVIFDADNANISHLRR